MFIIWFAVCTWWQRQSQHRAHAIRLASFAFIAGTLIGPFLFFDTFYIFCLALLFAVMAITFSRCSIGLSFLILFLLLTGIWRYQVTLPEYTDPSLIHFYQDQKVSWQGTVVEVQNRINQQKLVVNAEKVLSEDPMEVRGRVLVSVPLWPKFDYGDTIEIECTLKKPEQRDDFNYAQYLAKSDIYVICGFADIHTISSDNGNVIFATIYHARSYLQQRLYQTLSEPQVSIIDGMILGNAYGIPAETNALFSALGLTHIIAISGSHIVIMISLCMWLAINCRLKRQQAFLIAVAFVVVYIILVGAPPSAVRAGIMGVIVLLAQQISRRHQPLHTLLLTAALMLAVNPKLLLWDIGFQLSFAAVFGLLVIAPIIEKWWRSMPNFFDIRTMMSMTVAAQFATLPILIFQFKQVSPWSIVANFLILPIVPFMTIYALAHVLVAGVSVWVGSIMGWGSWLLVSYWLFIASVLSRLPLVTIFFQGVWVLVGCLASLVVITFFIMRYRRFGVSHDIL